MILEDRSNLEFDLIIMFAGVSAAIIGSFLILTQVDCVSRRFLSPLQLRVNRREEQKYRIEKAISSSILHIRRYINDGHFYEWAQEKKITDLMRSDDAVQKLVKEIVVSCRVDGNNDGTKNEESNDDEKIDSRNQDTRRTPLIVGISKDLTLSKVDEWYLHLAFPIIDDNGDDYVKRQYGKRVQVPLAKFGRFLAAEFEEQNVDYKLCFIADASSSLGSHFIGKVIQHSKFDIPLIQEPAWMFTLAFLIQTKSLKRQDMEKVLYGLCCLSAQGVSHNVGKRYDTISLTLPGQASSASLLSNLQHLFPSARYILLKDDCVSSISRSLSLCNNSSSKYPNSRKMDSEKTLPKDVIPETVMPRDVSSSLPIHLLQVKQLRGEFASLNNRVAGIVEAWISSVNTFDKMEHSDEFKGSIHVCDIKSIILEHGNDGGQNRTLRELLSHILVSSGTFTSFSIEETELDAVASIIAEANDYYSSKYKTDDSKLRLEEIMTVQKCKTICDQVK